MTYIMLINNKYVSLATDQYVLTQEHVKQINSVDSLQKETIKLRDIEQNKVKASQAEGFKKGYEEGLRVSMDKMKSHFIEHLEVTTKRVIEAHIISQQSIIELALNITRKIASDIGPEDMIIGIIRRAVNNLKSNNPLEIIVNAELAADVEEKLQYLLQKNHNNYYSNIEVIPDSNMGILDCVISSDSGITEASFEQQLKVLEGQLRRVVHDSNIDL